MYIFLVDRGQPLMAPTATASSFDLACFSAPPTVELASPSRRRTKRQPLVDGGSRCDGRTAYSDRMGDDSMNDTLLRAPARPQPSTPVCGSLSIHVKEVGGILRDRTGLSRAWYGWDHNLPFLMPLYRLGSIVRLLLCAPPLARTESDSQAGCPTSQLDGLVSAKVARPRSARPPEPANGSGFFQAL